MIKRANWVMMQGKSIPKDGTASGMALNWKGAKCFGT